MSFIARTSLRLASIGRTTLTAPSTQAALFVPILNKVQCQQHRGIAKYIEEKYFGLRAYNQFGLYHDDILNPDSAHVKKACDRLPDDILDARNFRITRALQMQVQKSVLPKELWTEYEDDKKNGKYLQPYIDEIIKEEEERAEWNRLAK